MGVAKSTRVGVSKHKLSKAMLATNSKVTTFITTLVSLWLGILTVLFIYILFNGKINTSSSYLQPVVRHAYAASVPAAMEAAAPEGEDKDTSNSKYDEIANQLSKQKIKRNSLAYVIFLSHLLPPIRNITRIQTPSREMFLNYIAPVGLPVIFTDMLSGTKLDDWSWEMVKQKWGEHIFHNARQGNYSSKVNKLGKHSINRVSVRLSRFIDLVTGASQPKEHEKGLYITKQKVLPPNALDEEFHYPPFYPGNHQRCFLEPTGWIGASGTFTQGHIDSKDNFVYQLIGQKQWTIYPPQDYQHLYYTKAEKGSLEWSKVLNNKDEPDSEMYPLYAQTHPIQFTMQPGEVLYLPRGWTHFVVNLTPSLMINTWRRGPAAITELWNEKNRRDIRRLCY